jgi:protease IV
MFSRRHPFLFFILIFSGISAVTLIVMSLIFTQGLGKLENTSGENVGVIELSGVIADSKVFVEDLKIFREDDSIKAIVVRIDSPGGGVGPSQEIYRAIQKAREKKHVISSMGAVAASGGYYAASATEGIMANPGTITGSIGVIMGYTNFKSIFDKIGLVPVVFKSGDFKDTGSPVREMREDEKVFLQNFVDQIYEQFVNDVATGRNMNNDTVKQLADGRIYSGLQAKKLGLVDRIGNLEDAVDWAAELAGITGEINVVYPSKRNLSILDYLTEVSMQKVDEMLTESKFNGGYLYTPGQ